MLRLKGFIHAVYCLYYLIVSYTL